MLQMPPTIAALYRPASDREVCSRSFGVVKFPRNPAAHGWEERRGTLEDQAIFGPLRDFECACGKYRGTKYKGMICDGCGVKVTTTASRRQRFGHIDLPAPTVHPLGQGTERLSAIPVLPAVFRESRGGQVLAAHYDGLVRLALADSVETLAAGLGRLMEVLLPIATAAHEWRLQDAENLAWGLGLERRTDSFHDTCRYCGYPLEGLDVPTCPGCGNKLGDVVS